MLASLLVAFSVLIPARCLTDLSSEYTHHAVLDPKELMKLYWTVDWDKETIAFAVEAETTGWVGFGLSSGNGKMVGSDVVIGWVKDNTGYLTDRYADDRSLPRVDEEQNYILTGAEESDKKTVLKFKRKFDTCDPRDRKIKRGTTKVVFAYHTEDPTSENDIKQHTFRGSRSILLLNSMDKQKRIDETGWNTYVFQARNVSVPKRETTYWCTLVKAPPINTKHHVTKFEPYIQEGNEGLVHHMILYECHGNFNDSHRGPGYNCRDQANMPLQLCFYYSVLAAWAVGGQAFYYPTKAGFPIGIADSPKNYMIEIHYNNPEGIEGRTDSSGFRFYYTSKLRQYDAGIFAVGDANTNFLVIPPKQESWLSAGYCSKECNQHLMRASKLTEGGINVFASFLHTHLQGRAVWTKHFRDGVELPEIVRDDNYDFNFQDMQVLRKEVLIKPGDDLVHYCKFQTMDRDDLVVGGDATTNEMCVDFLFYYPRIANATSFCTSTLYDPVYSFIQKYFPAVSVPWPNPLANMKVNWTKDMVSDLRRRLDEAKTLLPSCLVAPGRNQFPPPLPVPKITKLLPPTESKCPKPIPEDPDNFNSSSLVSASYIVVLFTFVGSIMFL